MKRFLIAAMLACLALCLVFPGTVLADDGLSVGPSNLGNITLPQDGTVTANVYITTHYDGKLIIGTENLPFTVEPAEIQVTSTDKDRKVELVFHGNESVEGGQYAGKITFLAYQGGNVAYGVKIKANVTQTTPSTVERFVKSLQANYILIIVILAVLAALVVAIVVRRRTKKQTQ